MSLCLWTGEQRRMGWNRQLREDDFVSSGRHVLCPRQSGGQFNTTRSSSSTPVIRFEEKLNNSLCRF